MIGMIESRTLGFLWSGEYELDVWFAQCQFDNRARYRLHAVTPRFAPVRRE